MSCVITTCHAYPEPPANLIPLAAALRALGMPVFFAPWQSAPEAAIILPLCAWDYAAQPECFRQWVQQAVKKRQKFANPPELMLWNMHKHYLCDLQARGVNVIPTLSVANDETVVLDVLADKGWNEVVIKPAIGQSGNAVQRVNMPHLPDLRAYHHGIIVQPFIADIMHKGETSLIFFAGKFSHAVLRRPAKQEWRANSAYGVTVTTCTVSEAIITAARHILQCLPEMPLYARVDGIVFGDTFLLNELELIEPALYLDREPQANTRLAHALLNCMADMP